MNYYSSGEQLLQLRIKIAQENEETARREEGGDNFAGSYVTKIKLKHKLGRLKM